MAAETPCRVSAAIGLWLLVHCWGTIALAIALFTLLPTPLTFVLAAVVIGSRQLGLAILMHEAAHNALLKPEAGMIALVNSSVSVPL